MGIINDVISNIFKSIQRKIKFDKKDLKNKHFIINMSEHLLIIR